MFIYCKQQSFHNILLSCSFVVHLFVSVPTRNLCGGALALQRLGGFVCDELFTFDRRAIKVHFQNKTRHGGQWTDTPCRCSATSSAPSTTSTSSVTTSTSAPSTTSTGTQSHLHERYIQIPKALYVWNPGDLSSWWDWTTASIDLLLSVCRVHGFKRAIVFIGSVQWDWEHHFAVGQLPHQEKFITLFAELRRVGVMPYEAWQTWERIGAVKGFKI